MDSTPQEQANERFEVGNVLASGGMGVVYRAYDRFAQREVAYKRLRVTDERERPRLNALFQREYDTLARLDHPNIVAVYDYGFDGAGPYYAMELLPGADLARLAPLGWRESCRLLRDVGSALALVHARRLVHRDVSPNNVRISHDGRAKLLDFGALTPFGTPTEIVGTPAFIAPECLAEGALDQRADLYSLGALAYWTLTGRTSIRAQSLADLPTAWAIPFAPPSTHVASIPRELDELVLSLLQSDKMARPRSAADVIERLTTIAGLDPEQHEERVALSYSEHAPLVGRAEAIDALRGHLHEALQSRGSVVLVDAAPGMGRTAVLDQLAIDARLRGVSVLRAQGKIDSGPLGLVIRLVDTGLATFPALANGLNAGSRSSMPSPIQSGRGQVKSPMEAAEEHARWARSMQDLLVQISECAALLLLIDDADCADTQSLGVLASMLGPIAGSRILLVITRRAGPPPSDSLAVLQATGRVISLAPLSLRQVGELARGIFGDVPNVGRVANWLYDESGGAPGSCIDLVRVLLVRGEVRYSRGTFLLPTEFERGLGHAIWRVSALTTLGGVTDSAQQLARLISLCETPLRLEQLATASEQSPASVFAGLTQLSERRLLVESGGRYAFASQLVRAAVSEAIPPKETRALHLALARTLTEEYEPSLLDRYGAGHHRICAGAEHELAGAHAIAQAARDRNYEVALSGQSVRFLEAALTVFRRHGVPDRELVDLLVPLSVAGFYGDVYAQRRHLDATMRALYGRSGLALATRLKSLIGARLALIVGILCAVVIRLFWPKRARVRTLPQDIESVVNVVSAATASAASIMEHAEAERVASWLDPFAYASRSSGVQVARQFCLAVSELPAGKFGSAEQRLASVQQALLGPLRGMDDRVREQMTSGCLHALAQGRIEGNPRQALDAADKLVHRGAFFAPHAELVRTLYHGFRGELSLYERHRARAEALALRGGISWSALVLLTLRDHQVSLATSNLSSLVRVAAELARIAPLGTWIGLQLELAKADVLLHRGQPLEAVPLYASVLDQPGLPVNTFSILGYAMYARALRESGSLQRAKLLCESTLRKLDAQPDFRATHSYRSLTQQLALAEADLGEFEQSEARLDEQLALASTGDDNPLTLGALQRDRALGAIRKQDTQRFEQSFAEMKRWFMATGNPWLIQQCDAVLTRAMLAGLREAVPIGKPAAADACADELDSETLVG